MIAQGKSLPASSEHLFQPKQSFGSRLVRSIVAAQQRKADREILRFSSIRDDWYRAEFGTELEQRLLGR
jgi:hypothetical protein